MAGVSAESVQKLIAMMEPEFKRQRIVHEDVKIRVIEMLLQDEIVMDDAAMKYGIVEMMETGDFVQDVIAETSSQKVQLKVHVSSEHQRILVRNNPDVVISFEGGVKHVHTLSYCQRIIDTQRCLKHCSRLAGSVLDFGGNHETHYRAGRIIHCCNFCDSVREMHRQTERLATSTSDDVTRDRNMCMAGAQNCDVKGPQSISIHAMPDIPWEDWPLIMDKHDCAHHVGVFHYDPIILTATHGKLPDSDMLFFRDGEKIDFFFEEDSSFHYTHSWSNLLKYVTPWVQVSEYSPYAYIYDVISMTGGVVTGEIVRVEKNALGRQVAIPLHAYRPREALIEVTTIVDTGDRYVKTNSAGRFKPVTVTIDQDLFQFMMMYGVSNDTEDPSQPMDRKRFSDMVYVYGHTRKLGNVVVSGMGQTPATSEDVINALWHVVLREHALLVTQSAQLTNQLVELHRTPNIPWPVVMAQLALAPIVAPGASVVSWTKHYKDAFAKMLKKFLKDGITPYAKKKAESYIRLGSTVDGNYEGFLPGVDFKFSRPDVMFTMASDEITDRQFVEALSDSIAAMAYPKSNSSRGNTPTGSVVDEQEPTPPVVEIPEEDDALSDSGVEPEVEPGTEAYHGLTFSDAVTKNRKVLYAADYAQLLRDRQRVGIQRGTEEMTKVPDVNELHKDYRAEMREYAMYQIDIGYSKIAEFVKNAKYYAPGGITHWKRIANGNNGSEVGAYVYDVSSGIIPLDATRFAIGIGIVIGPDGLPNYIPGAISPAPHGRAAEFKGPRVSGLYVENAAKIFNEIIIGDNVLRWLRGGHKFPMVEMHLVDGVPGCGKTTEIVSKFDPESTMIVCAGRHAKDDTLLRLQNDPRFEGMADLIRGRVKTVDSINRNGHRPIHVDVLEVDEGLMLTPGQIKYVIAQVQPKLVRVYGDSFQITAIDRSPVSGELAFKRMIMWTAIETRDVSHSMPADVTWLLDQMYYKRGIRTTSPVMRSLSYSVENSVEAPCFKRPDVLRDYMSILVADKNKLLAVPGFDDGKNLMELATKSGGGSANNSRTARVFTVHEAQGQRLERVTAVRMNPNTVAVLSSSQHIVVCLSRHYLSFRYHTLTSDVLTKHIQRALDVGDSVLRDYMNEPSQHMIKRIAAMKAKA